MVQPIELRGTAVQLFPALAGTNFAPTSPEDPYYNCIAWAAEEDFRGWWPKKGHWPDGIPKNESPAAFKAAFGTIGYVVCPSGVSETGFTKLAFYVSAGKVRHAARLIDEGVWTSKLGPWIDMSHELKGLEGTRYGHVDFFMKRRVQKGI